MSRNGSGTYTVPNTFVAGDTITASGENENFDDLGLEITNSVAADGQTSMTGPLKASNGSAAAPSYTFGSDTDTGFYRIGSNSIGLSLGGVATPVTAFDAGTLMLFQQTAAPTGWTKQTTHNNKALRVVSGTASSGGSTGFTSVFTARTIGTTSLPASGLTTSGTVARPTITGTPALSPFSGALGTNAQEFSSGTPVNVYTTDKFSQPDNPTFTGSTTGNMGLGNTIDFAVQYVDLIIASKD